MQTDGHDLFGEDVDRDRFERALLEFAANLLRAMRGTGQAHMILKQCAEVLQCAEEYERRAGHPIPSLDIQHALLLRDRIAPEMAEARTDQERAEHQIISGALQAAAALLSGRPSSCDSGLAEIHDGVCALGNADHSSSASGRS